MSEVYFHAREGHPDPSERDKLREMLKNMVGSVMNNWENGSPVFLKIEHDYEEVPPVSQNAPPPVLIYQGASLTIKFGRPANERRLS